MRVEHEYHSTCGVVEVFSKGEAALGFNTPFADSQSYWWLVAHQMRIDLGVSRVLWPASSSILGVRVGRSSGI